VVQNNDFTGSEPKPFMALITQNCCWTQPLFILMGMNAIYSVLDILHELKAITINGRINRFNEDNRAIPLLNRLKTE